VSANYGVIKSEYFLDLLEEGATDEANYPDLCNISRPTETPDVFGSSTSSYSNVATNVPCSWAPKSGAVEGAVANRVRAAVPYEVKLAETTDVKAQDRVIILAREGEPQRTMEVKAVINSPTTEQTLIAVMENEG
jgi:hypothetical protein